MKISELPLAGAIAGTEVFPIVQGGETRKVSIADALAGAGGVPTLQQVTDVTDGNSTTNDIINYYDIVNNYVKLTNDINGGNSQTPGVDIRKSNTNGSGGVNLFALNSDPTIEDYKEATLSLYTGDSFINKSSIVIATNDSIGENISTLGFTMPNIGRFVFEYATISIPRIYFDDFLGHIVSLQFSATSINANYNNTIIGLSLNFDTDTYLFGAAATGVAVNGLTRVVKIGDSVGNGNGNFIQVDDSQETIRLSTASGNYNVANIRAFTDNADALAGGLSVGDLYRHDGALESADQLRIVH